MEFFPDQWIKPNEYSYCGGCGRNETLMKCHHKDRPPCLFCRGGGYYVPNLTWKFWSYWWRFSWLHWLISPSFRRYYREITENLERLNKERNEQIENAARLREERIELARHRKEDLGLPKVFWMK